MEANCKNCFWFRQCKSNKDKPLNYGRCHHINNKFKDESENVPSTTNNTNFCSNWQAKDTDDMRCTKCRYIVEWLERMAKPYPNNEESHKVTLKDCLLGKDCHIGCAKFWPKEGE